MKLRDKIRGIFPKDETLAQMENRRGTLMNEINRGNVFKSMMQSEGFRDFTGIMDGIYNEALMQAKYGVDETKRNDGRMVMIAIDKIKIEIDKKMNNLTKALREYDELSRKVDLARKDS